MLRMENIPAAEAAPEAKEIMDVQDAQNGQSFAAITIVSAPSEDYSFDVPDGLEDDPEIIRAELLFMNTPETEGFSGKVYGTLKNIQAQCSYDYQNFCGSTVENGMVNFGHLEDVMNFVMSSQFASGPVLFEGRRLIADNSHTGRGVVDYLRSYYLSPDNLAGAIVPGEDRAAAKALKSAAKAARVKDDAEDESDKKVRVPKDKDPKNAKTVRPDKLKLNKSGPRDVRRLRMMDSHHMTAGMPGMMMDHHDHDHHQDKLDPKKQPPSQQPPKGPQQPPKDPRKDPNPNPPKEPPAKDPKQPPKDSKDPRGPPPKDPRGPPPPHGPPGRGGPAGPANGNESDSDEEDEDDMMSGHGRGPHGGHHRDHHDGHGGNPYIDRSFAGALGYGASGDMCMYQHASQLSPPCVNSVVDLYALRQEYYQSHVDNSAHHPHFFLLLLAGLCLLGLMKRACMYKRRKAVRDIIQGLHADPELKATVESRLGVVVPVLPTCCHANTTQTGSKGCLFKRILHSILFLAFTLLASLFISITSLELTSAVIEKTDRDHPEAPTSPGFALFLLFAFITIQVTGVVYVMRMMKAWYVRKYGNRTNGGEGSAPSAPSTAQPCDSKCPMRSSSSSPSVPPATANGNGNGVWQEWIVPRFQAVSNSFSVFGNNATRGRGGVTGYQPLLASEEATEMIAVGTAYDHSAHGNNSNMVTPSRVAIYTGVPLQQHSLGGGTIVPVTATPVNTVNFV